jgi:hypothetical protein
MNQAEYDARIQGFNPDHLHTWVLCPGTPPASLGRLPFEEIWVCDFEFIAEIGHRPDPVCMVAKEVRTGRQIRLWRDELQQHDQAPFRTDDRALFVAYFASAEISCFLALGWPVPRRILDLFAEFRVETNGLALPAGRGLLGALIHYDLPAMGAEEKDHMRQLVLSGGPWNAKERQAILDYCAEDVGATARLLSAMAPATTEGQMRLGHALIRGRYMGAVAAMEWHGIPIDMELLHELREHWDGLRADLIREVDRDFDVYEDLSFRADRFASYLNRTGISWLRLPSGALALDDDTFRQMARAYPAVAPLRELRHALSELRLNKLSVGADGRNRTLLSPFQSRTGRNQPSNSAFIFGPSRWLRGLIKPGEGHGVAYLDWGGQEVAIAAARSGDKLLWHAYDSGDPYLAFAVQAGLAPSDATKETHRAIRDQCKVLVLGVQYGMSAHGVAQRAGVSLAEGKALLQRHRETYRRFWEWSDGVVNQALLGATLTTPFGWRFRLGTNTEPNPRSLMNFPMQSGGADMMRLACAMGVEAGLTICAPIHDALLLEAPLERLDEDIDRLSGIMRDASELVLGEGRQCRVDVKVVRFPDRYMDEAGEQMWSRVMALLAKRRSR